MNLDERVRMAHGDAWQAEGHLRAAFGGGAAELPGVRLMASGLPHQQWNNGDVHDPARFPLDAVRDWYAARAFGAGVPWGVRVPAARPFAHGRHLFRKRCMGLERAQFVRGLAPSAVRVRAATRADAEIVAAIDAAAFETPLDVARPWALPHLESTSCIVALAEVGGETVGVAMGISTDAWAGPALGIFGVGVLAHARRRGVATALTAWLVERGFSAGAQLAHLNPNDAAAAAVYRRLGFVETAGFDVYVGL